MTGGTRLATQIAEEAAERPAVSLPLAQPAAPEAAPAVLSTPAVRLIVNRIAYAVKIKAPLCVVGGPAGTGKTTSAQVYVQHNPRALMWTVPPEYTAREIVADLCDQLRIDAGEAWRVRTSVLTRHLLEHPRTVLLDEAQRLDYKALDMLKYVADASKSTFVLLGNEWIHRIIDRHSDIKSRAWVRVRPEVIDLESFTALYLPMGYQKKTLKALHDATGGVMRSIVALCDHLDEALTGEQNMTRADLLPEHVRAVADEVLS